MVITTDEALVKTLKQWSRYFTLISFLIAIIVLLGWQFNIPIFIHPLPKLVAMNPATSITFILFAISFFLLRDNKTTSHKHNAGKLIAVLILLLGSIKLTAYFWGVDPLIDSSLYADKIMAEKSNPLYHLMSPITALCFMLAGISLLFLNFETSQKHMPSHYSAFIIAIVGLISLLVYIYTEKAFYGILTYVPMAIHTAVNFLLISIAILFTNPDKGIMKELTTPFAGSVIARQLIPIAVFVPIVLGTFRLYAHLKGILTSDEGTTMLIVITMITLLTLILFNARLLNKRDLRSKQVEDDIRQMNHFHNAILENIPDMIFVKDAKELRFIRFNKAGEELLGYSRHDLIGKNDYDLFPKAQADFFTNKDKEVIKEGDLLDITEEPINTRHGERWLHTKKIPVRDENGKPLYLVGISEDITERRKTNEQLKQFYAELEKHVAKRTAELQKSMKEISDYKYALDESSIVEITDQKGIIKYSNKNFCKISKYTAEELIGQDHRLINSGYHTKEFIRNLWENIASGRIWRGELKNKAKDGSIYWVDTTIIPFLDEKGNPYQYLAIRFDITERKKAEEEIPKLNSELRNLLGHIQKSREDERKYIAREIHDELGQALTALKIDASLMRKKIMSDGKYDQQYLTDELHAIIEQIDDSISTVKKIASDLRPEILDYLDIIEVIKWQAQQFKNNTGIPCHISYLPDHLNLNPHLSVTIYRTVQEALTNITRHAEATLARILIELDSKRLLIEVSDNGKGIDEEEIKKKNSLGLLGMRERVLQLNGKMTLTGKPGKGTTLSVEIPV